MKKLNIAIVLMSFLTCTLTAKDVIQLIGLENDTSSFSRESYSVMYDSPHDGVTFNNVYAPYKTIAIQRRDDKIEILERDFLVVPTANGFKYMTQSTGETLNDDTTSLDECFDFLKKYKIYSTYVMPRVFNNQKSIKNFISAEKPSFRTAINIDYEKISFVTPNFYITEGFFSEVNGGATLFNAEEVCNFYKLDLNFPIVSNRLSDFINRKQLNKIIINAVKGVDYTIGGVVIDQNYILPWGNSISDHDDVFFTLDYTHNQVRIVPLTLLNGNSARSFLEKGEHFTDINLLSKLKLKNYGCVLDSELEFVSPDMSTRVNICKKTGVVKVYDNCDNRLLLEDIFPLFNKLIMSEWAEGRFVDIWSNEFK